MNDVRCVKPTFERGMATGILLEVASIELRFVLLTHKYRTIRDFLLKNRENNSEAIHM
jgi:hypothetical protein